MIKPFKMPKPESQVRGSAHSSQILALDWQAPNPGAEISRFKNRANIGNRGNHETHEPHEKWNPVRVFRGLNFFLGEDLGSSSGIDYYFAIRHSSFVILLLLALTGCKPAAPAPTGPASQVPKTYAAQGVVQAVAADRRQATIKHDAIPGYMAAMTMDFSVRDTNALAGIAAGDKIAFTLAVTDTDDWIENVQRISPADAFGLAGPSGWHVTEPGLEVGDLLPDYEFTDENNQRVRFSDFRGRALAFTFFFTSCPLPEYCPRMNQNFAATRKLLRSATNAPADWQLLSISFDAAFDTPQMLSSYARLYRGDDTNRWLFAAASTNTLAGLAPKVDLSVWREGGTLSHNMRTVVLDPAGKIARQFDGNAWTPAQLAEAIIEAATKR